MYVCMNSPALRGTNVSSLCISAVAAVHVEFEDGSHDDRVVAEFLSLLQRSSSTGREQILTTVQRAAAKLRQCEVELAAVKPTGSVVAYFVLKSLSAAYELDTLYNSDELKTILEEIFTCLLKSSRTVRIKTVTWAVNDYNRCVQYFLRKLGM